MKKLKTMLRAHGIDPASFGGNMEAAIATLRAILQGQESKQQRRHGIRKIN